MSSRTKLNIDWNIVFEDSEDQFKLEMERFSIYLKSEGYRDSTIILYLGNVYRYLKFAKALRSTLPVAEEFRDKLLTSNLGRSSQSSLRRTMALGEECRVSHSKFRLKRKHQILNNH
jgi:hypothetical protein